MASLESARLKIFRAVEHYGSLESQVQRYLDARPADFVKRSDAASDHISIEFETKGPVPPQIALTVGDCLVNMRSSLDYLVWELVLSANGQPTKKNAFPICKTVSSFKGAAANCLSGVAKNAIKEIELLQPYHYGQEWELSVLWILNELSNINKHRRVLMTTLQTDLSPDFDIITHERMRLSSDENAVVRFAIKPGEKVQVKVKGMIFIALNEGPTKGQEIGQCLNGIAGYLDTIVFPKFARFFDTAPLGC
jgi:hypothetical protein